MTNFKTFIIGVICFILGIVISPQIITLTEDDIVVSDSISLIDTHTIQGDFSDATRYLIIFKIKRNDVEYTRFQQQKISHVENDVRNLSRIIYSRLEFESIIEKYMLNVFQYSDLELTYFKYIPEII